MSAFPRSRALILLGHGSSHNPDSSRPTRLHADAIRRRGVFDEVFAAFWKEKPHFRDALTLVKSDDVVLVPFFISNGYFTEQIIPREFGLKGRVTESGSRRILYAEPVGTHASMTRALLQSADLVVAGSGAPAPPPMETTLIVVGHGTEQNDHSADAILRQVELLKAENRFADVRAAFTAQEPRDADALANVRTSNVIVTPFFISDGQHSGEDIPVSMGFAPKGRPWKNPVEVRKGEVRRLWYARAIGSEPAMEEVILERAREVESQRVLPQRSL